MRFIMGLIVGAALTIGGAYIHDNMGGAKPLVDWSNAREVTASAYEYVKAQFDRAVNWATSGSR